MLRLFVRPFAERRLVRYCRTAIPLPTSHLTLPPRWMHMDSERNIWKQRKCREVGFEKKKESSPILNLPILRNVIRLRRGITATVVFERKTMNKIEYADPNMNFLEPLDGRLAPICKLDFPYRL